MLSTLETSLPQTVNSSGCQSPPLTNSETAGHHHVASLAARAASERGVLDRPRSAREPHLRRARRRRHPDGSRQRTNVSTAAGSAQTRPSAHENPTCANSLAISHLRTPSIGSFTSSVSRTAIAGKSVRCAFALIGTPRSQACLLLWLTCHSIGLNTISDRNARALAASAPVKGHTEQH